jgi:hypothetical protein
VFLVPDPLLSSSACDGQGALVYSREKQPRLEPVASSRHSPDTVLLDGYLTL